MATENTQRYCCFSNVTAVKVFAGLYMAILGIIGFIMGIIWTGWHFLHEESLDRNVPFWAMSASFTFWFFLSILVLIGGIQRRSGMLKVCLILAIFGILGLFGYLVIYYFYHPEGLRTSEEGMFWVFVGSCVKIFFNIWYTLCISGAMKEIRNGDDNNGIVYSNPGAAVEMGPMNPVQPGYAAVPTQQPQYPPTQPPQYPPSTAPPMYPPLPNQ